MTMRDALLHVNQLVAQAGPGPHRLDMSFTRRRVRAWIDDHKVLDVPYLR